MATEDLIRLTGDDLFVQSDVVAGMAFPEGRRASSSSAVTGPARSVTVPVPATRAWLGSGRATGVDPWCYDPVSSAKGTHAYPYIHQVWAYDANDLMKAKRRERRASEIRPYASWRLTEMDASGGGATIRGATFEPQSGRLFVTTEYGEEPRVHVYRVRGR